MSTGDVAGYYNEMQRFYRTFWHPTGVHYGVWDNGASNHDDAVQRTNGVVADALGLAPGSRVLDAGCGVGGTSFYLAEKHRYAVTGLTLSEAQLAVARRRARSFAGAAPSFSLGDYTRTGFATGSFDGMFGIESICYEAGNHRFAEEAFRILRSRGRLVVLDGFAGPGNGREAAQDLRAFCDGFAIRELVTGDAFTGILRRAGFVDIRQRDLTRQVLPSARRIRRLAHVGTVLTLLAPLARQRQMWRAHCRAGRVQQRLLERGGMRYLLFTATRP